VSLISDQQAKKRLQLIYVSRVVGGKLTETPQQLCSIFPCTSGDLHRMACSCGVGFALNPHAKLALFHVNDIAATSLRPKSRRKLVQMILPYKTQKIAIKLLKTPQVLPATLRSNTI